MDPLLDESAGGRRTPASRVALGALGLFALGMVGARWLPIVPGVAWFALASGLCALAGVVRGDGSRRREGLVAAALGLALACVGAGVLATRAHEAGGATLGVVLAVEDPAARGRLVTLEGVVLGAPEAVEPARGALASFSWREPTTAMIVRTEVVIGNAGERVPVRGRVRVRLGERAEEVGVRAGDAVRLTGMFVPVRGPMNPGEADRRLVANQAGEAGTVFVPTAALIEPVGERGVLGRVEWSLRRGVSWVRSRAGAALGDRGGPEDRARAMLRALVLGERDASLSPVQRTFERVGIAHLLAISGFHLTVLAASFVVLLRVLGDFGRLEAWLVVAAIVLCVVVVPARAPIVRAAALAIGMVLGSGLGRRYDAGALLGWIGIGLLVWRPMDVFNLGFQLSVGLTLALVWFGARANAMLAPVRLRGVTGARAGWWSAVRASWGGRWVTGLLAATLVCWSVALPTILVQTGVVSAGGVVATVLVVPMILPTLWLGYAAAGIGIVWPEAGAPVATLAAVGAEWSQGIAGVIERVPGAWVMSPVVGTAWGAAATAWIVVLWSGCGRRAWMITLGLGVLGAWMAIEGRARARIDGEVRVDMLAVGDGTCVLVRSGDDAMLWDCGSTWLGVGERLVPGSVRALGVRKVRRAVISHANIDHFSGLLDAAVPLGIEEVIVSEAFLAEAARAGSPEAALMAGLGERGIRVRTTRAGESWTLGRARVEVIQSIEAERTNDRSLVVAISADTEAGMSAALLVGDLEDDGIEALRGLVGPRWECGKVEVMELPHHGSFRRSAEALVSELGPRVVMQSTGPMRLGDVRWAEAARGRRWWTTAADGWAWATIRSDGSVRTGAGREAWGNGQ
ncbi:MAG: ComEC/Rec2 family competence protein [Phycisphaerales bacterium JB037]